MDEQTTLGIITGTFSGTTLMTLFSYLVSLVRNRQFIEPVLLNRVLCGLGLVKEYQVEKHIAGWIIHYLIGFIFLLAYYFLWTRTGYNPTIVTALVLGTISGLAGIAGWMVVFRLRSAPPNLNVHEYYFQLFIAHLVFAIAATATYKIVA